MYLDHSSSTFSATTDASRVASEDNEVAGWQQRGPGEGARREEEGWEYEYGIYPIDVEIDRRWNTTGCKRRCNLDAGNSES